MNTPRKPNESADDDVHDEQLSQQCVEACTCQRYDGVIEVRPIETKRPEKRISHRAKLSRMLRVRPSEGDADPFEELPVSTNVSKHGIYFHTHLPNYRVGMRLFVTYPFTFVDDPMKSEYLAEVIRVEQLADSRFGIAIRLLMTI